MKVFINALGKQFMSDSQYYRIFTSTTINQPNLPTLILCLNYLQISAINIRPLGKWRLSGKISASIFHYYNMYWRGFHKDDLHNNNPVNKWMVDSTDAYIATSTTIDQTVHNEYQGIDHVSYSMRITTITHDKVAHSSTKYHSNKSIIGKTVNMG